MPAEVREEDSSGDRCCYGAEAAVRFNHAFRSLLPCNAIRKESSVRGLLLFEMAATARVVSPKFLPSPQSTRKAFRSLLDKRLMEVCPRRETLLTEVVERYDLVRTKNIRFFLFLAAPSWTSVDSAYRPS
jgi:hypothetical protein